MQTLSEKILYLTKKLNPTGRAFRMAVGTDWEKVNKGIVESEKAAYAAAVGILDTILADNDNFTTDDAADWERRLGLQVNPAISLADRKLAINRKYASPGNVLYRQSAVYLEAQIQAAGFDVYIHESRVSDGMGGYNVLDINAVIAQNYGSVYYGEANYGPGIDNLEYCANYVDIAKDSAFVLSSDLRGVFYVGGAVLGDLADVDTDRQDELRKLILSIKPTQTVAVMLINYI